MDRRNYYSTQYRIGTCEPYNVFVLMVLPTCWKQDVWKQILTDLTNLMWH
jgi:hypothetical protein